VGFGLGVVGVSGLGVLSEGYGREEVEREGEG